MRYRTIVADLVGLGYPTLSVDEIAALPVSELAEADAHLYLWIPDGFLIAGHGAHVIRAWGFNPSRLLIWHKRNFGLGSFPRPQHEAIITAKRGSLPYRLKDAGSVHNWRLSYDPRVGKRHSEKPDGALDLIESASPGPYLELFARRNRLGWDTWGDEALEHVPLSKGTSSDLGSRSPSTDGPSRSSRLGASSPFQKVTDDLTDGCGCACHTGTGYRSSCDHCTGHSIATFGVRTSQ